MDNVYECDFSEVEPSASALVFLAVSFRLPAMALLLYRGAGRRDPRMSHYIFFPAIILTIKTTINNVICMSRSLTCCVQGKFSSGSPPCVENAAFFYTSTS